MKLNGCLREVSKVLQECFQGILRVFKEDCGVSFKVSKGSSKGVSRRFQRCFKNVSRKIEGCS